MLKYLNHIISEVRQNYSSTNWWGNRVFMPYVIGTLSRLHPSYPGYNEAIHVMDEDWDNLIILDACRADMFESVIDVSYFDKYQVVTSLGSHSSEWTRRNFAGKEFGDTVYVSANPHTSLVANDSFHHVFELWETNFDDEAGVVRPEAVQDAAIKAQDQFPDKRIIIHFMQPHGPFIGSELGSEWTDQSEYWQAYRENLEYTFRFVENILDSIPGKTVITADHGQIYSRILTELLGFTSHPPQVRYPPLVEVPWAVINGERRTIQTGDINNAQGEQIQNRLKDLGYL